MYWLTAIIGLVDFEGFDFDFDLDSGDGAGGASGLALFFRIGEVPLPVVISLLVLNFWVVAMLLYYLPIKSGGLMNGLLLIPTLALAMGITGLELTPLRHLFKSTAIPNDLAHKVMDKRCELLSDVKNGRLGQGRIHQRGAGVVVNVKAEFAEESFNKGEVAFIFRKDPEKDLYYITKPIYQHIKDTEGM